MIKKNIGKKTSLFILISSILVDIEPSSSSQSASTMVHQKNSLFHLVSQPREGSKINEIMKNDKNIHYAPITSSMIDILLKSEIPYETFKNNKNKKQEILLKKYPLNNFYEKDYLFINTYYLMLNEFNGTLQDIIWQSTLESKNSEENIVFSYNNFFNAIGFLIENNKKPFYTPTPTEANFFNLLLKTQSFLAANNTLLKKENNASNTHLELTAINACEIMSLYYNEIMKIFMNYNNVVIKGNTPEHILPYFYKTMEKKIETSTLQIFLNKMSIIHEIGKDISKLSIDSLDLLGLATSYSLIEDFMIASFNALELKSLNEIKKSLEKLKLSFKDLITYCYFAESTTVEKCEILKYLMEDLIIKKGANIELTGEAIVKLEKNPLIVALNNDFAKLESDLKNNIISNIQNHRFKLAGQLTSLFKIGFYDRIETINKFFALMQKKFANIGEKNVFFTLRTNFKKINIMTDDYTKYKKQSPLFKNFAFVSKEKEKEKVKDLKKAINKYLTDANGAPIILEIYTTKQAINELLINYIKIEAIKDTSDNITDKIIKCKVLINNEKDIEDFFSIINIEKKENFMQKEKVYSNENSTTITTPSPLLDNKKIIIESNNTQPTKNNNSSLIHNEYQNTQKEESKEEYKEKYEQQKTSKKNKHQNKQKTQLNQQQSVQQSSLISNQSKQYKNIIFDEKSSKRFLDMDWLTKFCEDYAEKKREELKTMDEKNNTVTFDKKAILKVLKSKDSAKILKLYLNSEPYKVGAFKNKHKEKVATEIYLDYNNRIIFKEDDNNNAIIIACGDNHQQYHLLTKSLSNKKNIKITSAPNINAFFANKKI